MHILYFTPYYKPSWSYGGPPRCISDLAEYIVKRYGYKVSVITLNQEAGKPLYKSSEFIEKDVEGVNVYYLPIGLLSAKYFTGKSLDKALQKVGKVDVIHTHMVFNYISKKGMELAIGNKIPWVASLHGMMDPYSLTRQSRLKALHYSIFEKRYLQKSNAVLFTTENEYRKAQLDIHIHPVIIPVGFPVEGQLNHDYNLQDHDGIKLVYLGRINRKKGLDLTIKALSQKENISLDIYGEDDDNFKNELNHLIKEMNLIHRITFKGALDPKKRLVTLSKYDALILNSHQENFGMVIPEALESKIPVLISENVDLKDFVTEKKCGIVCKNSEEAIVKMLTKFENLGFEERAEMGYNGYIGYRKLFSIKNVGHLHNELYTLIIKQTYEEQHRPD